MNAEEQKVRATWTHVTYREPFVCISTSGGEMHDDITVIGWPAAAAFTDDRLEQIAEIEEEIEWLHKRDSITPELQLLYDKCDLRFSAQFLAEKEIFSRTLARLTAIRDDLKRGMK